MNPLVDGHIPCHVDVALSALVPTRIRRSRLGMIQGQTPVLTPAVRCQRLNTFTLVGPPGLRAPRRQPMVPPETGGTINKWGYPLDLPSTLGGTAEGAPSQFRGQRRRGQELQVVITGSEFESARRVS